MEHRFFQKSSYFSQNSSPLCTWLAMSSKRSHSSLPQRILFFSFVCRVCVGSSPKCKFCCSYLSFSKHTLQMLHAMSVQLVCARQKKEKSVHLRTDKKNVIRHVCQLTKRHNPTLDYLGKYANIDENAD
ncbi:hypothetical protein BpHYR1_024273 [Brachionus plicatilis]|uniref:Uncharacterized protein n=1 Tax=Brachionus plicatilis TaxID=10195 RepID=A0A3M7SEX8_BRAPC|nr:hypothetical protein BpHYR1_024273 [Brachionus plicatilis]